MKSVAPAVKMTASVSTKKQRSHEMNGTENKKNQQQISIKCPEENLAALIAESKANIEEIFAIVKSELIQYLLSSKRAVSRAKICPQRRIHQLGKPKWICSCCEKKAFGGGENRTLVLSKLRNNAYMLSAFIVSLLLWKVPH